MARPRGDPQGPRPARCVGVHRAHLRCVHRRACARLGASGRRRDRNQDPEEREHHPQPDARDAVLAGSPGALLPPACARLGRHRIGAQSRPQADVRDPAVDFQPSELVARLFPRRAEPAEEIRRRWSAGDLRERLLGQSRVQAAAGGQSAGDDALPRGARLPEGHRQGADDLRRQESAPELARGRRAEPAQCRRHRRRRGEQHGGAQHGRRHLRPHRGVHRTITRTRASASRPA